MQRFLVGPGMGGAKLTKAAIEFIIKKNSVSQIDSFSDDGYGNVFVSYVNPERMPTCDALYTEWYKHYCSVHQAIPLDQIKPNKLIDLPIHSDIRDLVIMYMVNSLYDSLLPREYIEELDQLNNGYELRIIEVPDGYHCHIVNDMECGYESVEEFSRMWVVGHDSESFTKQQIKRFAKIYADGFRIKNLDQFGVGEFMDLLIVVQDNRAVVFSKLSKQFAFLKKTTYHTANNDHPKEWFEIIGDINFKYQTVPLFFDVESVQEYYDLVGKMMASISTRESLEVSNGAITSK